MNKPDKRELIAMALIFMLGLGLLVAGISQEYKYRAVQQTINSR